MKYGNMHHIQKDYGSIKGKTQISDTQFLDFVVCVGNLLVKEFMHHFKHPHCHPQFCILFSPHPPSFVAVTDNH